MVLFVYGTLTPGHEPACVTSVVSQFRVIGGASVRGKLLDLGDYPGLLLGDDGLVSGTLVEAPDDASQLRRLDAYEGWEPESPDGSLFRRVAAFATLESGQAVPCQTYVFNGSASAGRVIASGDWFQQDRSSLGTASPPFTNMKRPLIGITSGNQDDKPTRYEIPADYARGVELAGGLPVMIPFRLPLSLIPEYVDRLDGIVFIGGDDLDPALYGQERHPKAIALDGERERFELALLAEVERRRLPALGICLGSQLMNVHRGGSLSQFLPDLDRPNSLEHRFQGDSAFRHSVQVMPETILSELVQQPTLSVNSRHKQAVLKLGNGLRISAVATDGVIEAFEDPSLPLFLAIQWHPENLASTDPEHLSLFKKLIDVAAQRS